MNNVRSFSRFQRSNLQSLLIKIQLISSCTTLNKQNFEGYPPKNQESRTKNQEPRTKNQEPRIRNQKSRIRNQKSKPKIKKINIPENKTPTSNNFYNLHP